MRQVYVNSSWLSGGLAGAQALTALAYWLVARTLGPDAFGEVVVLVSVATLVVGVADFGFGGWVVRELARKDSEVLVTETVGLRLAIAVAAALGWFLVTALLWSVGHAPGYSILLGIWVVLFLVWNALVAPLKAQERMARVVVVTVSERIVFLLAVLVAVEFGQSRSALVVGLVLGALSATFLAALLVDERAIVFPSLQQVRLFFFSSFGFAASSLALQVQRLDVPLVGIAAGSFAAGIYAAPARLLSTLTIIPSGISSALFPHYSKGFGSIWDRAFIRLLLSISIVMFVVMIPIFVFAEPLVTTLLGEEYAESVPVLRIVLVATLIASVNQPISVAYQARGDEHFVAIALGVSMAIGLSAIAVGAAISGATGAGAGFLVLQVVVLTALLLRAFSRVRPPG